MSPLLKYVLKVWQTAVFATPLIIWLFTLFQSPGIGHSLQHIRLDDLFLIFVLMAVVGMLLSVPSALLLWWSADLVIRHTSMDVMTKKTLLCLLGILLTIFPFLLLNYGQTLSGMDSNLCMFYTMTIGMGVWFYDWDDNIDKFSITDN